MGARVFGIVGRDGGYTAASPTPASSSRPCFAERITPHTEGLVRRGVAPARQPPGAASRSRPSGSRSITAERRSPEPDASRRSVSSSAAPASSAVTSRTGCWPTDDRGGDGLRQLLVGAGLAPRPSRRRPALSASSAPTRTTSPTLMRRDGRPRTVIHLASNPDIAAA